MGCPRCGGMSVTELVAAMHRLVCEKTILTAPYCHCHDVEDSMWACSLPEGKAPAEEPPTDCRAPEMERS